jgi:hypothetical protein
VAVLKWVQKFFGTGSLREEKRAGKNSVWRLQWSSAQCEAVLQVLLPYLKSKQAQAELACTIRSTMPEDRHAIKVRLSQLKKASDTLLWRDQCYG